MAVGGEFVTIRRTRIDQRSQRSRADCTAPAGDSIWAPGVGPATAARSVTMRLGLFGGSFDPVHYGHLLLAECCREQCKLDEVWFLPAATPPHKQSRVLTSGAQRIEMLQLAVSGHEMFRVCPVEIERGGVSFTVDTLAELSRQHPGSELFFLLGRRFAGGPAALARAGSVMSVGRAGCRQPAWRPRAQLRRAGPVRTARAISGD